MPIMNHGAEKEKELYQSVRNKVKRDMKDVVTNLIHKTRDNLNQETVDAEAIISEVSKIVSSSDAYRTLKRSLVMGIINDKRQHSNHSLEEAHSDWEGCLTNNFASLNSSPLTSSQCSYVLLGTKELMLATKLLRSPSLQDKLQSLNVLRQTSSLEQFISPQVWPFLQPVLKETLLHPVVTVGEFCLDVYVNMLLCSSAPVVKESYSSLLEFLVSYQPNESHEIQDTSYSSNKIFMQATCIINKFQQNVSKHWLRYPQNIMDDIIKITFKHFSLSVEPRKTFTNLWTIMTIIDTGNIWLKNWLHGRLSRKFVVNAIQEHREILEKVLKNINEFESYATDCREKYSFLLYEVSCSLCFVSHLLQYSEGRKLICNRNTCESFGTDLFEIWSDIVKCILVLCNSNHKFYNYSANFVSEAMYSLWENTACMWNEEKRYKILKPLILPLEHCKIDNTEKYIVTINEITKSLSAVTLIDACRIDLFHLQVDEKLRNVLDWLTNGPGSEKLLHMHSLCDETLINMVKICRNMLSTPHGILQGRGFVITLMSIQSFQTCWSRTPDRETPTFQYSITDKTKTKSHLLHEEMLKAISTLLSSPFGTSLLNEANYLLESIDYLFERYSEFSESPSLEQDCNCYHRCFMWFSLYSGSLEVVQKNNLLLMFPNKIWQNFNLHLDNCSIDCHTGYSYVTNKLKSLVFLYPAAKALYNQVLCKVNSSDTEEKWKSISLLLLDGIQLYEDGIINTSSSILCSLVCSMKTFLFMEQRLQIRAFLLKHLNDNAINGVIVIDENSLLWNHILVRSYVIGGPKERKLPPKHLKNVSENYDWPFVSQESVNENYWQIGIYISSTDESSPLPFVQLINNTHQKNFYQEVIVSHLKAKDEINWQYYSILMEDVIKYLNTHRNGFNFSCLSVMSLSDSEYIGIELAIQYGINLGFLDCSDNNMKELECTLNACKISIDGVICTEEFDVFVTTVFLLLKGDRNKTCTLLQHYVLTQSCLYNWILPLQMSLRCDKLKHCHAVLSQYFEVIVKDSLPKVFSAFQICGLSPSAILWHWTSQCFWNYLDWTEICHWVLLTITFGNGSILYFAVAIMKHLEKDILAHAQNLTLLDYLKESSISQFKIYDYINLILELSEKFHDQIESSIEDCVKI